MPLRLSLIAFFTTVSKLPLFFAAFELLLPAAPLPSTLSIFGVANQERTAPALCCSTQQVGWRQLA